MTLIYRHVAILLVSGIVINIFILMIYDLRCPSKPLWYPRSVFRTYYQYQFNYSDYSIQRTKMLGAVICSELKVFPIKLSFHSIELNTGKKVKVAIWGVAVRIPACTIRQLVYTCMSLCDWV